jgi:hypothetical protein
MQIPLAGGVRWQAEELRDLVDRMERSGRRAFVLVRRMGGQNGEQYTYRGEHYPVHRWVVFEGAVLAWRIEVCWYIRQSRVEPDVVKLCIKRTFPPNPYSFDKIGGQIDRVNTLRMVGRSGFSRWDVSVDQMESIVWV